MISSQSKRGNIVGNVVEALTLLTLPDEVIQTTLMNLDTQSLACLIATTKDIAQNAEAALRTRAVDDLAITSNFGYIHPYNGPIPNEYKSMASYLVWYERIRFMINDSNWRVRMKALQILGELAPVNLAHEQFADAILHMLNDPKAKVRKRALQTMQNIGTALLAKTKYAHAVGDMIDDQDKYVKITALQTLNYIEPHIMVSHTKYAKWLSDFRANINHVNKDERTFALRDLLTVISPVVSGQPEPAYVIDVIHKLQDTDTDVRCWALTTVEKLGQVIVEQYAWNVIRTLEFPEVCMFTLRAMKQLGPETLAHHANAILTNGLLNVEQHPHVRKEALETLQNLEPATLKEYYVIVVSMLNDTDRDVRITALKTLRKLEPAVLAESALDVIHMLDQEDEENELVRKEALVTLARLEPVALKMYAGDVVRMLKDNAAVVCDQALITLCKLKQAALTTTLVYYADDIAENLEHTFDHVRKTALKALHMAGPVESEQHAGDVVNMLNKDCSDDVRNMALIFLDSCGDYVRENYPEIFHNQRNQRDLRSLQRRGTTLYE